MTLILPGKAGFQHYFWHVYNATLSDGLHTESHAWLELKNQQTLPNNAGRSVCSPILSAALGAKDTGKTWLSRAFNQLTLWSVNKGQSVSWIRSQSVSYLCKYPTTSCLDAHTNLKEEQDTYVLFKTLSSFRYQLGGCAAQAASLALINIKIYKIFVGVSSSTDPHVSCTSSMSH